MKQAIVLVLMSILVSACKSKVYTLENYPNRKITFGNGGGFTGMTDTYVLFENGQLFNRQSMVGGEMQALLNLEKTLVKQIFENFYTLKLHQSILNDPGNMTFFVKMEGPEAVHSLKWGGPNQEANPNIVQYYRNLYALGKLQKQQPIKR